MCGGWVKSSPPWARSWQLGELTGTRVQQMMLASQRMFLHSEDVEHGARRWNHALQEAAKAAGFSNAMRFFEDVMNDTIFVLENRPGISEEAALRAGRKAALKRIPANFTVADNFSEKFDKLVLAHKEMSELLNTIAEDSGLYKNDPRTRDPLTGKKNLMRHAIKYGLLTAPRKLNGPIIQKLVKTMVKAGWKPEVFANLKPADAQAAIATYFTPDIAQTFVDPFVRKPGAEVFFGAKDADGRNAKVSQIEAQAAWEKAGGDVQKFTEVLFDMTSETPAIATNSASIRSRC